MPGDARVENRADDAVSARISICVAAPTMSRFAGISFLRQRVLEHRQAASRQQRVVAVDLREQRLLRRYREDLRRRDAEHRRARFDLAVDLAR